MFVLPFVKAQTFNMCSFLTLQTKNLHMFLILSNKGDILSLFKGFKICMGWYFSVHTCFYIILDIDVTCFL